MTDINDYKQHQFSGEFPLEFFCVLLGFGLLSENKKVISFFIIIVSCSGWDVFNFWVQMVFQLNQYNWLEIGCSLDSKLSDIKLCFGFLKLLSMIYGLNYSTNMVLQSWFPPQFQGIGTRIKMSIENF